MPEDAREIPAAEFKAKCLALLDEVSATGLALVVTKRGKPVARIVPLEQDEPPSLLGSVDYASERDLLAPVAEGWDADG